MAGDPLRTATLTRGSSQAIPDSGLFAQSAARRYPGGIGVTARTEQGRDNACPGLRGGSAGGGTGGEGWLRGACEGVWGLGGVGGEGHVVREGAAWGWVRGRREASAPWAGRPGGMPGGRAPWAGRPRTRGRLAAGEGRNGCREPLIRQARHRNTDPTRAEAPPARQRHPRDPPRPSRPAPRAKPAHRRPRDRPGSALPTRERAAAADGPRAHPSVGLDSPRPALRLAPHSERGNRSPTRAPRPETHSGPVPAEAGTEPDVSGQRVLRGPPRITTAIASRAGVARVGIRPRPCPPWPRPTRRPLRSRRGRGPRGCPRRPRAGRHRG